MSPHSTSLQLDLIKWARRLRWPRTAAFIAYVRVQGRDVCNTPDLKCPIHQCASEYDTQCQNSVPLWPPRSQFMRTWAPTSWLPPANRCNRNRSTSSNMMTRGRDVKFDLILHKIYEMRLLNPRNWLEYVTCVAMEKFAEQIFDPSLQAFAYYTKHSTIDDTS